MTIEEERPLKSYCLPKTCSCQDEESYSSFLALYLCCDRVRRGSCFTLAGNQNPTFVFANDIIHSKRKIIHFQLGDNVYKIISEITTVITQEKNLHLHNRLRQAIRVKFQLLEFDFTEDF